MSEDTQSILDETHSKDRRTKRAKSFDRVAFLGHDLLNIHRLVSKPAQIVRH